jgi:hypothetical protein
LDTASSYHATCCCVEITVALCWIQRLHIMQHAGYQIDAFSGSVPALSEFRFTE